MMLSMRTTVTLDADTMALIERAMKERGLTFKEAVNFAVRRGLSSTAVDEFSTPTYRMGMPKGVDLDKALRLASDLEDAEILFELERGR
jgi:Arc/MetJ family transcription regulator